MSELHKELQKVSVKEVEAIIKNIETVLKEMTTSYNTNFSVSKLSDVQTSYGSSPENIKENKSLITSLVTTRDVINMCVEHINQIRTFILLHVPKMEDGNNFGVTVQLQILKEINDTKDKWLAYLEKLPTYYSTRADAIDKISSLYTKESITKTTTTTESESKGGKDGDENKTSTNNVTESKSVLPPSQESASEYHRIQHIYALDVQEYFFLKNAFSSVKNDYIMIIDSIIKNKDKLTEPKGSDGGSNFSSMY